MILLVVLPCSVTTFQTNTLPPVLIMQATTQNTIYNHIAMKI
jgi:hypothetical protein